MSSTNLDTRVIVRPHALQHEEDRALVSPDGKKEVDESPDDWWMHEDSSLEKSSSLEKRLELLQA